MNIYCEADEIGKARVLIKANKVGESV